MLPTLLRLAARVVRKSVKAKASQTTDQICIRTRLPAVQQAALTIKDKFADGKPFIDVYTDASVRNNGILASCTVGFGIHWPQRWHGLQDVSGSMQSSRFDNNGAELLAIIKAMQQCRFKRGALLRVFTDSQICVDLHRRLNPKLKCKNFRKRHAHLIALFEMELSTFEHRPKLEWVEGHKDSKGNAVAHQLARKGSKATLFRRQVLSYGALALSRPRIIAKKDTHVFKSGAARTKSTPSVCTTQSSDSVNGNQIPSPQQQQEQRDVVEAVSTSDSRVIQRSSVGSCA